MSKKRSGIEGVRGSSDDMKSTLTTMRDWVPIRVYQGRTGPSVDWCYAGSTRLTQPFFNDSVSGLLRRPFSLLFRHQTSFDLLRELYETRPGLQPTGFIFHMSRCGSTLVSQMLAAVERNIVISEAPPIDSSLHQACFEKPESAERLRWMISSLGWPRNQEENYFIKFDSWNTLDLELITRTFSDVPWIFLYRDPVEVIVSHMQKRGSQMIPGSVDRLLPGLALEEAVTIAPEEFCARVLAQFCETALTNASKTKALFVNYTQLPGGFFQDIIEHFGVAFTRDEIRQMEEVSRLDAKTPQVEFRPDSKRKQIAATDAVRKAAAKWVDPVYARLEETRLKNK